VSAAGGTVDATVVIVTRDRRDLLRDAIGSSLVQTVEPEVIVVDDASSDGTQDMVRAEFPHVRLFCSSVPRGCVPQRTAAAQRARGRIVVSIDDDCLFRSRETLERTLAEFDHPRIGAVAIPYVDQWTPGIRQAAPAPAPAFATFRFAGGANAVRRDLFIGLGGYRTDLVQQGEETDFCLRMLAAGYVARLGTAPPLVHLVAEHDDAEVCFYSRRNDVLHAWRNVPMPYLPGRLVKVLARSAVMGVALRRPGAAARGTARGAWDALRNQRERRPVGRSVYRAARVLKAREAIPLAELEPVLPPLTLETAAPSGVPLET
jgi:GT2 family glycosyltransferase